MEPGAFDEALAPLLPLVEADIFGAVAEAKEVAAFAGGLKEAKKQRGYEAYRLLAQGVTFRTHTAFLLSLVGARFSAHALSHFRFPSNQRGNREKAGRNEQEIEEELACNHAPSSVSQDSC